MDTVKLMILVLFTVLLGRAQAQSADDIAKCEKDGFEKCFYGINWGDEVDAKKLVAICKATKDYELLDSGHFSKPLREAKVCYGPTAIAKNPDLKGLNYGGEKRLGEIVAKAYSSGTELTDEMPPAVDVLSLFTNKPRPKGTEWNRISRTMLRPVRFGTNARFMIILDKKLVGFATSSILGKEIDPVFFLLEAKKKYGPTTLEASGEKAMNAFGATEFAAWDAPSVSSKAPGASQLARTIFIRKEETENLVQTVVFHEDLIESYKTKHGLTTSDSKPGAPKGSGKSDVKNVDF